MVGRGASSWRRTSRSRHHFAAIRISRCASAGAINVPSEAGGVVEGVGGGPQVERPARGLDARGDGDRGLALVGGRAEGRHAGWSQAASRSSRAGLREGFEGISIRDPADIDHAELVLHRREDDVDDPSAGCVGMARATRP